MKKLKVLTVVGTRPELIRLSEICKLLDATESIEHVLVNTGQNSSYELNELFFEDLELRKPAYSLSISANTTMTFVGIMLQKIDTVLEEEKPDAFLILGDTNSGLSALAAKKRRIPIFHLEAGNRCWDTKVPEETNRKLIDHLSDINLPYSAIARENLLREGLPADRTIKIGSPMREVLHANREKINCSGILEKLELTKENYFIVSFHRFENLHGKNTIAAFIDILNEVAAHYSIPVIVSTHPHTKMVLDTSTFDLDKRIRFLSPLSFTDYNCLQINAKAVLSDSGTLSEEAAILGFGAINLRETHERPEAMEEAAVIMTGLNKSRVMQGLAVLFQEEKRIGAVQDYEPLNVSQKVLRILISYVDYVNRKVWA